MPLISRRASNSAVAYGLTGAGIPPIQYLIVAGGGGAAGWINGVQAGASGGAGGLLTATSKLFKPGITYTVTVGLGGASSNGGTGSQGQNSVVSGSGFTTLTAIGGGYGGANGVNGGSGGSGGGGGAQGGAGGTATSGQGYAGSAGDAGSNGGAGGGAGGAASSGAYGVGIANPITDSTVGYSSGGTYYLAGGGSAASGTGTYNTYGGGNNATDAYPNTGSGGGGGGVYAGSNTNINGAGGSGVIVFKYPKSWRAATTTGSPTVITTSTHRIYQFTSSGSITF